MPRLTHSAATAADGAEQPEGCEAEVARARAVEPAQDPRSGDQHEEVDDGLEEEEGPEAHGDDGSKTSGCGSFDLYCTIATTM